MIRYENKTKALFGSTIALFWHIHCVINMPLMVHWWGLRVQPGRRAEPTHSLTQKAEPGFGNPFENETHVSNGRIFSYTRVPVHACMESDPYYTRVWTQIHTRVYGYAPVHTSAIGVVNYDNIVLSA
jgi:hypothetical protein